MKDFPKELLACPACGSGLTSHTPETPELYEAWTYFCSAEIIRVENGLFTENEYCRDSLNAPLAKLNAAVKKASKKEPART